MTETAVPAEKGYREFVREVFIDPIRAVTVIDDEFPTLDGLLAEKLNDEPRDVEIENCKRVGSGKFLNGLRGLVLTPSPRPSPAGRGPGRGGQRKVYASHLKIHHYQRVQGILEFCRSQPRNWLVDIHDGGRQVEEIEVAEHLSQSDLLVLDYQLDKKDKSGDRAIEILRKLAENDHFNLVVVYT